MITLPSGLQYQALSLEGKSPKATAHVKMTWPLWTLLDGTVFTAPSTKACPATFPADKVIKGWIEALQKMKVGDKWKRFVLA